MAKSSTTPATCSPRLSTRIRSMNTRPTTERRSSPRTSRIGGHSVGIVANQRHQVRTKKAGIQMGGVIYSDSADKAARFVMDCNQTGLPIIFFQDVTGFMVGRDAEQSGIIRSGAKLVNAVSNSIVPKITVVVGGSFGAGNYALCGKAYDPRFILAWPNARYAVMGAAQASDTVFSVLARSRERGDKKGDAGRPRTIARQSEGDLRRANRHPIRRRPRLARRDHPAARDARCPRAIVRLRRPADAAGALSHGRGANLSGHAGAWSSEDRFSPVQVPAPPRTAGRFARLVARLH